MKIMILAASALLSAGAAQDAGPGQPYAKVGDWEITAEDDQQCSMTQLFESKVAEDVQVLSVLYDAKKGVVLSLASRKPKYLLASGSAFFELAFIKGKSSDGSWGNRRFEYKKRGNTYYLHHVFAGHTDTDRILGDLSSNEIVSLFLGPTLVMGLPLNASGAVEKLRECVRKGATPS